MFSWNESYSLNIPSLDDQHKILLCFFNKLYRAMDEYNSGGQDEQPFISELTGLLEELFSFAKRHFLAEEELMQQADYPDYANHKARHIDFLNEIKAIYTAYQPGNCNQNNFNLLNLMSVWLLEHFLDLDKRFASFFHNNNRLRLLISNSPDDSVEFGDR